MSEEKTESKKRARPKRPEPVPDAGDLPPLHVKEKHVSQVVARWDILPAKYNPRIMQDSNRAVLSESIGRGLWQPLVWNRTTKALVGGHQRLKALDEHNGPHEACSGRGCADCHGLGIKPYSITVAAIEVDEATEKRINVELNNPKAMGQYDLDLLPGVLLDIKEHGIPLEDTGFEITDLAMMGVTDATLLDFAQETPAAMQARDELADIAAIKETKKKARTAEREKENAQVNGQIVLVCNTAEEHKMLMQYLGRGPDDDIFFPARALRRRIGLKLAEEKEEGEA